MVISQQQYGRLKNIIGRPYKEPTGIYLKNITNSELQLILI